MRTFKMNTSNRHKDDALQAAIGSQTTDIIRIVQAVAHDAAGDDLPTLDRAAALVELNGVADRLDELLDRLQGLEGLVPEDVVT
jgi:hypothetical protein